MKVKILGAALAVCLLLSACSVGETAETKSEGSTVSSSVNIEALGSIACEEVESVTYTRYTEGGPVSGCVTDDETIREICRCLSGISLGEENSIGTSDDGLHLTVDTGGEPLVFYFEGDNYVIDSRQYAAEGLSSLKKYIDGLISEETEEAAATESTAQDTYQYWNSYNGYAYEEDGQLRYWIEFGDEFYLHCMFRSGDPEYYEEVYTLYPDWEMSEAQQLVICTVKDGDGNDISDRFESLIFLFSSEDTVTMQVKRDEQTLAGGAEDNILTGEYTLKPRETEN